MASAVPQVVTALYVALRAALAPAGWQVMDGQPLETLKARKWLAVGWHEEEAGAAGDESLADYGPSQTRESFDVNCMAVAAWGNTEHAPLRKDVYDALDTVKTTLSGDPTLGEACALAQVTSHSYSARQAKGAYVALGFTVHIEAWSKP